MTVSRIGMVPQLSKPSLVFFITIATTPRSSWSRFRRLIRTYSTSRQQLECQTPEIPWKNRSNSLNCLQLSPSSMWTLQLILMPGSKDGCLPWSSSKARWCMMEEFKVTETTTLASCSLRCTNQKASEALSTSWNWRATTRCGKIKADHSCQLGSPMTQRQTSPVLQLWKLLFDWLLTSSFNSATLGQKSWSSCCISCCRLNTVYSSLLLTMSLTAQRSQRTASLFSTSLLYILHGTVHIKSRSMTDGLIWKSRRIWSCYKLSPATRLLALYFHQNWKSIESRSSNHAM